MNYITSRVSIYLALLGSLMATSAAAAPMNCVTPGDDEASVIASEGCPPMGWIVRCGVGNIDAGRVSMMPVMQAKAGDATAGGGMALLDETAQQLWFSVTAPSHSALRDEQDCQFEFDEESSYPLEIPCANGQQRPEECVKNAKEDYKENWEMFLGPGAEELCWLDKEIDERQDAIDEQMDQLVRKGRWIALFQAACDAGDSAACQFRDRFADDYARVESEMFLDQLTLNEKKEDYACGEASLDLLTEQFNQEFWDALELCCDQ